MIDIQIEIDKWENTTHVYVGFSDRGFVSLEGDFYEDELSKIANILRKIQKQAEEQRMDSQEDT